MRVSPCSEVPLRTIGVSGLALKPFRILGICPKLRYLFFRSEGNRLIHFWFHSSIYFMPTGTGVPGT